jgi:DNA-binding HxlR family transcriptional regulator
MQLNRDDARACSPAPLRGWTDPQCPVARTLDLVGDRWSLLIVRDAMDGAASFSDFHTRLGIARNILTDRLRRLVDAGILTRIPAASGRRHSYALTDSGRDLFTTIVALRQWGERHTFHPGEPHSRLLDDRGSPVPELRPKSSAGRPLRLTATHVEKVADAASGTPHQNA